MGSQDQLVSDLMRKPRDAFRDQLVANATAGMYHDYKSEHATPKLLLFHDLTRYGYRDLARRAKRGDYDDEPDASEAAEIDAMIAANPALASAWEEAKKTRDPQKAMELFAQAVMSDGPPLTDEQKVLAMAEVFPEGHPRTQKP